MDTDLKYDTGRHEHMFNMWTNCKKETQRQLRNCNKLRNQYWEMTQQTELKSISLALAININNPRWKSEIKTGQ